jgi:hypothetical protein
MVVLHMRVPCLSSVCPYMSGCEVWPGGRITPERPVLRKLSASWPSANAERYVFGCFPRFLRMESRQAHINITRGTLVPGESISKGPV